MLPVRVPEFGAEFTAERGHVHGIIVDQADLAVRCDQEVAVLDITVGDSAKSQAARNLVPGVLQLIKSPWLIEMGVHVPRQSDPIDPCHPDYRKPVSPDFDAFLEV